MTTMARTLPVLTPLNRFFWQSGQHGRLEIQRCDECRTWQHPPGPRCPSCLGTRLTPQTVSGNATVETFTINYQAWTPGLAVPYVILLVSLDDCPEVRLTSNLIGGDAGSVHIRQRMRVVFEQQDDVWLPLFTPV
jgi:uncharacterized protein